MSSTSVRSKYRAWGLRSCSDRSATRDGQDVHSRLLKLRNTVAAHTDASDVVRLILAVKEEPDRVVVRHLWTMAVPVDELAGFSKPSNIPTTSSPVA